MIGTLWLDLLRTTIAAGVVLMLAGTLRLLWVTRRDVEPIAAEWRWLVVSYGLLLVAVLLLGADDFGTRDNVVALHAGTAAVSIGLFGLNRVLPLGWPPWVSTLSQKVRGRP